jgi:8-oxo-dGTP pyrophosphatase MutT (NUDIX family)
MRTILIAKALVLDVQNDVLLMRRSGTHPTLAHHPDLPGGLIEEDEDPTQALVREIKEETGLDVNTDQLKLAYTGTEDWEGDSRIRMLYVVRIAEAKPKVTISWEHEDASWIPLEKLPAIEHEYNHFYKVGLAYLREKEILRDL